MLPRMTAEASLPQRWASYRRYSDCSAQSGIAPALWMHRILLDTEWDDVVSEALGFGDTLPQDIGGGTSSRSAGGGSGSGGTPTAPDWLCLSWDQCCRSPHLPRYQKQLCCKNLGTEC